MHALRRPGEPGLAVAAAGAAALLAALQVLASYALSPFALPLAVVAVAGLVVALRRPAAGVAGAFLALPLVAVALPLPTGSLSATEGVMALVGVGYLARLALAPATVRPPTSADLPFAGLLLVALCGLAVAVDPAPIMRVVPLWALFYCVSLQVRSFSDREIAWVVASLAIGAGALGAMGTLDYLRSGETVVYAGGTATGARAVGTFADPNYYASLLQLAVVPGLALVLARRSSPLLLLAVAAAAAGVVFSLSRGAMVGLAFALLVFAGWARFRRIVVAAVVLVALLTVSGLNPVVGDERFTAVTTRVSAITETGQSSTNNRPRVWAVAFEAIAEDPVIGVGLNQFQFEGRPRGLTEDGSPLENAHNIFISLAVETGLVGLAFFLALLGQLAARAGAAVRSRDPFVAGLGLGIGATFAGFLLQGLTVVQIRENVIMATFLVLAGVLFALAARTREHP